MRRRLRPLSAAPWLAARRLWANRGLAAALACGFTIAVSAAAAVPVYVAGSLQRVLEAELNGSGRAQPAAVHIAHLQQRSRPTTAAQYEELDRFLRGEGLRRIGLPADPVVGFAALDTALAVPVDPERADQAVDRWVQLGWMSGLAAHAAVYDGRLPVPGRNAGGEYEALVEDAALDALDMTVGAAFWVPLSQRAGAERVKVRVVGAFRRADPADPYWFMGTPFERVLFLDEPTARAEILPRPGVAPYQYSWYFGIASSAVRVPDAIRLLGALYDLEARAAQLMPDTELFAAPDEMLVRYARQGALLRLLFLALSVPVLVVAAYYLVVTSGQMVAAQRQEIAVLRSRGATAGGIVGLYALEGVLLAGVALALGWPGGIVLARLVGAAAGFLQLVDRRPIPVMLDGAFWGYGLAAALLAVAAYVVPALAAAGETVVTLRRQQARAAQRPFWQRWGLDAACLLLAGYGFWAVRRAPPRAADVLAEPLYMLLPVLLVFGAGLVVLRLMPYLWDLPAWLADRRAPVALNLALRQLARAPGHHAPVVLLLIMAVGMGLYAGAVARTRQTNTADQVAYRMGADLILFEIWPYDEQKKVYIPPPWQPHEELSGVTAAARVRVEEVIPAVGGRVQERTTLMAIDPWDFGRVAWSRADLFAPYHLNDYLNLLAQSGEGALASQDFFRRNRLEPGDRVTLQSEEGRTVEVAVWAAVPYWPSLFPERGDFLIANLDYVEEELGLFPYRAWLALAPGAEPADLIRQLAAQGIRTYRADDRYAEWLQARRAPELMGLMGILTVTFLLSAALAVLGFWLHAALSLRGRLVQFGMLRAVGLEQRQLMAAVALEQVAVAGAGVLAGALLGLLAGRLFVPFLQQGVEATARTPPFVVVADPADRARLYAVMLTMLLTGLAGLAAAVGRLRIHEALKLGEDQ